MKDPDAFYDRMIEAEALVAEMAQLLRDIRNCGEWYYSALEIDTFARHGHHGENLPPRIDAILARVDGPIPTPD